MKLKKCLSRFFEKRWVKIVSTGGGVILCLLFVFFVSLYVWAGKYEGRIAPNVWVGSVFVGGMDMETATQNVQSVVDDLLASGVSLQMNSFERPLAFSGVSEKDVEEYVQFSVGQVMMQAIEVGHHPNRMKDAFALLQNTREPIHLTVPVEINEKKLEAHLRSLFEEEEQPSESASYYFFKDGTVWDATVKEGKEGEEVDSDRVIEILTQTLPTLAVEKIEVSVQHKEPEVSVAQAEAQKEQVLTVLNRAPYMLVYEDEGIDASWEISGWELSTWMRPTTEEFFALDEELFDAWLDRVAADVDVNPVNARFDVTAGRVEVFVPSTSGIELQREETYEVFIGLLQEVVEGKIAEDLQPTTSIVIDYPLPEVTTASVNDLGITGVLGVGTSNYWGSPYNRRLNIWNGVQKLNGILIPPGETFSLLDALKPFTFANGYYEELVIKGDKIEPEVGGGLCQIGTTTFRAAMNSGLPIVSRNNHSLVVSYYNDPTNGNPGTDATIYDPAPDFQFLNDTDNYVLFQAEMPDDSYELTFTFWGTSDGRRGSYTPPVVERWIPVGDEHKIETLDLEPGVEECQEAHIGADASFTYTIVRPNGEIEETYYESHYRPLPRMCLVGVEALSEEGENEGEAEETEVNEVTEGEEESPEVSEEDPTEVTEE
jgi:vancomycin resistance protein YoaR